MGGRAVVVVVAATACGFSPGGGDDDAIDASPATDGPIGVVDGPPARDDARPIDGPPTTICPPDYTATATGHYRLVTQNADWLAAQNDCADDGATTHLVVITDNTEIVVVTGLISAIAWIGVSDRVTEAGGDPAGSWLWVTETPYAFENWASGQPNGTGGEDQDCAEIDLNGVWADDACADANNHYVCECDANPSQPANY
jgi:hypothetical protein